MKRITLLLIFGIFIIAGCGANRKSAGILKQSLFTDVNPSTGQVLPTLFWSHYDATQRGGVYLVTSDGTVKVIAENPPDAGMNSTISALAKVKVGEKVDVGAKFSAIKAIAELGQRNAANYMIRDLAYRIEALKNNHNGGLDQDVKEIYIKLIDAAVKISVAESNNKIYDSKATILKELNSLIKLSQDDDYKELKLDSLIEKIEEMLKEE